MNIYQTLQDIIEKPDVKIFYIQLQKIFQKLEKKHEVEALTYLLEKKFNKNDNNSTNNRELG